MEELSQFNALDALVAQLNPFSRRKLAQEIGRKLRTSQAKRIKVNKNPDESAFEPRKIQKAHKQAKNKQQSLLMFKKLHQTKFLKHKSQLNEININFGRASWLASIHQFGSMGQVNKNLRVKYEARRLLGFSDNDHQMISMLIMDHLSNSLK